MVKEINILDCHVFVMFPFLSTRPSRQPRTCSYNNTFL